MVSTVNKKHSFWNDHIQSWKESGLSQPEYCEAHGIKLSIFSYYRYIYLKITSPIGFVSIKPKVEKAPLSVNSLQLLLPNGIRVMIAAEVPEHLLKMVINIAGQTPGNLPLFN
ncbi:IS66 family insertion sequence element accessory protein TnpA [Legionella maceachernii]|uniref:Transposase n=1 Tax=Legionella maceachernii TaxID=466 RepID=A0A0W0VV12_9GAMM|nr:hypothetical protein Lmac_2787 [Legionella maceachernii]SKA17838.1 hypothetical protein SAMN02745128_02413 [Legionella maceachernii]SUP04549.1 Uncharacterised protein [Legionella maceachernii]